MSIYPCQNLRTTACNPSQDDLCDVKISSQQAIKNSKALLRFRESETLIADKNGNLTFLSDLSLIERFVYWLKDVKDNSAEDRVAKTILATFKAIPACLDHTSSGSWFFSAGAEAKRLFFSFDVVARTLDKGRIGSELPGHLDHYIKDQDLKIQIEIERNRVRKWAEEKKAKSGISICEDLFTLDFTQATNNARVLHNKSTELTFDEGVALRTQTPILTVDEKGNLGSISRFNLIGRFVYWIKSLIYGSQEFKIHKAVLATIQAIKKQYEVSEDSVSRCYSVEENGKSVEVGFDVLANNILSDRRIFIGGTCRTFAGGVCSNYLEDKGLLKESAVLEEIKKLTRKMALWNPGSISPMS